MVMLVQGIAINLSSIMVRQMQEAASSKRLCLPYRMGLIMILESLMYPLRAKPSRSYYILTLMMTSPFIVWDTRSWVVGGYAKLQIGG